MVAAVDPERINLACPIVLDALNLQANVKLLKSKIFVLGILFGRKMLETK